MNLTTAGVTLHYAVETTKGERPTTGYKKIPGVKSTPDFNPQPEALDSTDLEQEEYKTYEQGLKDMGGTLAFGANFSKELLTLWRGVIEASKTAEKTELATWFEIKHKKLDESLFFRGVPAPMGMPEMGVNAIMETNLYITPTSKPSWETASTTAAG